MEITVLQPMTLGKAKGKKVKTTNVLGMIIFHSFLSGVRSGVFGL